MKYSELRTSVRQWFTRQVRIYEWSTDPPKTLVKVINNVRYPANIGLEAPIKDIFVPPTNSSVSLGQRVIHVVLPYAVQYRFSSQLKLYELPQTAVTSLYTNVVTEWLVNGATLEDDILSVGTTDIVESPITISRLADASTDWLITLLFEFEVECLFEPEKVPGLQPDDFGKDPLPDSIPVSITLGLWRSKSDALGDQDNSYLDSEL
jgi:hypothetical protein